MSLPPGPHPLVMGILNVTPDSFSDGGRLTTAQAAVAAGVAMASAGAAMVDVGGESTRPGAAPVTEFEERARVVPVVAGLAREGVRVTVDTRKAAIMRAALDAGAWGVNDVSALTDPAALPVIVAARCPVVLMHMQGTPETMQTAPAYLDVVGEVAAWLQTRAQVCAAAGVAPGNILIDPGIGFGKTMEHNLALLRQLPALVALGYPVVLGASRKAIIARIAGPAEADARLGGSLALALRGAEAGCAVVRVHDVGETVQALAVWRAVRA